MSNLTTQSNDARRQRQTNPGSSPEYGTCRGGLIDVSVSSPNSLQLRRYQEPPPPPPPPPPTPPENPPPPPKSPSLDTGLVVAVLLAQDRRAQVNERKIGSEVRCCPGSSRRRQRRPGPCSDSPMRPPMRCIGAGAFCRLVDVMSEFARKRQNDSIVAERPVSVRTSSSNDDSRESNAAPMIAAPITVPAIRMPPCGRRHVAKSMRTPPAMTAMTAINCSPWRFRPASSQWGPVSQS